MTQLTSNDLKFLEELSEVTFPKLHRGSETFLSIAGFPHYEDVISNIYAHFLDSEKYPRLSEIILNSLKKIYESKIDRKEDDDSPNIWPNRLKPFYVFREKSLSISDERIDIVLESKEQDNKEPRACIIIENKIYHTLENNLENYWNEYTTKNKVGILLVLDRFKNYKNQKKYHPKFVQITHQELLT